MIYDFIKQTEVDMILAGMLVLRSEMDPIILKLQNNDLTQGELNSYEDKQGELNKRIQSLRELIKFIDSPLE